MAINNEQIKAACILAQTRQHLHHSRTTTTIDEGERMTEIVTKEAAVMYERWLAIEAQKTEKNPAW